MRGYLEACGLARANVWLTEALAGDLPERLAQFGLLDGRVRFASGAPSTFRSAETGRIALLRIESRDPDLVRTALEGLYDRVTLGGFVLIDDQGAAESERAALAFRSQRGIADPLEPVGLSGASWRKTE